LTLNPYHAVVRGKVLRAFRGHRTRSDITYPSRRSRAPDAALRLLKIQQYSSSPRLASDAWSSPIGASYI
jgi:hypothetical protein